MKKLTLKRLLALTTLLAIILSVMAFTVYASEPETEEPVLEEEIAEGLGGIWVAGSYVGGAKSKISFDTGGVNRIIVITGPGTYPQQTRTVNGNGVINVDDIEISTPAKGNYAVIFQNESPTYGNGWAVS